MLFDWLLCVGVAILLTWKSTNMISRIISQGGEVWSHKTNLTSGAGTAYPSGAPGFTPG